MIFNAPYCSVSSYCSPCSSCSHICRGEQSEQIEHYEHYEHCEHLLVEGPLYRPHSKGPRPYLVLSYILIYNLLIYNIIYLVEALAGGVAAPLTHLDTGHVRCVQSVQSVQFVQSVHCVRLQNTKINNVEKMRIKAVCLIVTLQRDQQRTSQNQLHQPLNTSTQ